MFPTLSIIIPVYNTEKYLVKCLDSVINQTFKNIEIICINDGSTDNSLDILKEYQVLDNRVKILDKENGGSSSARNVGIEHAKGKYITFIDSDDFIELSTYESLLSFFNIPKVDLVYFSTQLVIEDGKSRTQDEQYFEHKYTGFVELSNDVIKKMDVCVWNKIYKLSIIKKYDIKFPNGISYEDNPFFWSYALVCDCAFFVNDKLYNYLIRTGSIMNQHNQKNKIYQKTSHELDSLLCFEYLLYFIFRWSLFEKFKPVLTSLFLGKIYETLYRLPKKKRILALHKSTEIVNKFNLCSHCPEDCVLLLLSNKKYHYISGINQFFLTKKQRLLGIWDADKYYIFCLLGIKIKIKK